MVRTASTMIPLGTEAPDFSLPDVVSGGVVRRDDFRGRQGLLVIFLCNHCPYVKHVAAALASLTSEYMNKGIAVVGVSSNDVTTHPDDGPEQMKSEAAAQGYQFPTFSMNLSPLLKLIEQPVLLISFFLTANFGLSTAVKWMILALSRIRLPPEPTSAALDAVLSGNPIPEPQKPSIGCNIKWKAGFEPDYFNPAGIS